MDPILKGISNICADLKHGRSDSGQVESLCGGIDFQEKGTKGDRGVISLDWPVGGPGTKTRTPLKERPLFYLERYVWADAVERFVMSDLQHKSCARTRIWSWLSG